MKTKELMGARYGGYVERINECIELAGEEWKHGGRIEIASSVAGE